MQRGGVIDAVAHEADDVPLVLECADDALLMRRREARKDVGLLNRLGQFLVGHCLDLAAEKYVIRVQAYFAADLARDEIVVPSQDFDSDAVVLQRLDRRASAVFRRIEEGNVTLEDQLALVILVDQRIVAGDMLVRDGEHAKAIRA